MHTTTLQALRSHGRGLFLAAVVIASVLAVSVVSASAQQVKIKRTFFTGWRYSTDGQTFHKVGSGADDLMLVMEDHRVCVAALRSYRAHSTAAKMTGLTATALIIFPLASNAITGDWSEGSTPMILVGLGFGVLSLTIGESGSSSLKQAVRIYNRYQGRYQAFVDPALYATRARPLSLSVRLGF